MLLRAFSVNVKADDILMGSRIFIAYLGTSVGRCVIGKNDLNIRVCLSDNRVETLSYICCFIKYRYNY